MKVGIPGIQFVAAANMAVLGGARLVELDIDPQTGNLDTDALSVRLANGLKLDIVCAVSYAGWPFDLATLELLSHTHGFRIIADQSHAIGPVELPFTDSDILFTYSFQSLKNITSGESGALATGNPEFASRIKRLRNHGTSRKPGVSEHYTPEDFFSLEPGYNYRITDFQAALLRSQLGRFLEIQLKRAKLAELYCRLLKDIPGISVDPNILKPEHALHLFTIRADRRDELYAFLFENGIGSQAHYIPLRAHPGLNTYWTDDLPRPGVKQFFSSILSLPFYPALSEDDIVFISQHIRRFYAA